MKSVEFNVKTANKMLMQISKFISAQTAEADGDADTDYEELVLDDSPGEASFYEYWGGVVERVALEHGMSEDDAEDAFLSAIDLCIDEGFLYPPPEDGALDVDFSMWVGQAESIKLEALVRRYIFTGKIS